MRGVRPSLLVRHPVDRLEAACQIAISKSQVRGVHRRVTVETCARLLHHRLPLREFLIGQHVGVPALLTEIVTESVP
jgi:hypothetical protein